MSATVHPSMTPYLDWARERLPMHFPPEALEEGLDLPFRVEGLTVWLRMNDRAGEETRAHTAPDEQALRRWIFERVCWRIAVSMAARPEVCQREEARWRFVEDASRGVCPNGMFYLRENPTYEFDAVFDIRKWERECALELMRNTLTAQELRRVALEGEACLNAHFPDKHWACDTSTLTYREVSYSRERDLLPRLPEGHGPLTPDPEQALDPSVLPYARWIREHLPDDVTDDEASRALLCLRDGRVKALGYWQAGESSPAFKAEDEEALRRRLYSEVCHWIAKAREPAHREQERSRYRYDWPTVREFGRVVHKPPQERSDYEYEGTFDHRKWWMEEHLRLLRGVADKKELAATASYYLGQLNRRYPDQHWVWNRRAMAFVEVSRSKQTGIEDALAGKRPQPWTYPKEKPFFVLRSFLTFVRKWFIGF